MGRRTHKKETGELDRRYVEGYRRKPETRAWAAVGAKLLANRLKQDRWQ